MPGFFVLALLVAMPAHAVDIDVAGACPGEDVGDCVLGRSGSCEALHHALSTPHGGRFAPTCAQAAQEHACTRGVADACAEAAVGRARGIAIRHSARQALGWRTRACELGREDTCVEAALGWLDESPRTAARLLRRGCEADHAMACVLLEAWAPGSPSPPRPLRPTRLDWRDLLGVFVRLSEEERYNAQHVLLIGITDLITATSQSSRPALEQSDTASFRPVRGSLQLAVGLALLSGITTTEPHVDEADVEAARVLVPLFPRRDKASHAVARTWIAMLEGRDPAALIDVSQGPPTSVRDVDNPLRLLSTGAVDIVNVLGRGSRRLAPLLEALCGAGDDQGCLLLNWGRAFAWGAKDRALEAFLVRCGEGEGVSCENAWRLLEPDDPKRTVVGQQACALQRDPGSSGTACREHRVSSWLATEAPADPSLTRAVARTCAHRQDDLCSAASARLDGPHTLPRHWELCLGQARSSCTALAAALASRDPEAAAALRARGALDLSHP